MKNTLLILDKNARHYSELLHQASLPDAEIITAAAAAEATADALTCNIILGAPGLIKDILDGTSQLQWIQSTWAGITPLLEYGTRKDFILTGVKGIFGRLMSEYVFCYLLMHERGALMRLRHQEKRIWDQTLTGTLRGKWIGIMGVGSIGAHLAKTAKHFEMHTAGFTFSSRNCDAIDEYYHQEHLQAFAGKLDYLVITLPDTANTHQLIDHKILDIMKPEALIINIGRGSVIDEVALVSALQQGVIGGAILDVFQEEPLPQSHPFWHTPNTIITSHTAAPTFPEDILPIFLENYHRFCQGMPLKYQIDLNKGY